jgi:hypothetical protein
MLLQQRLYFQDDPYTFLTSDCFRALDGQAGCRVFCDRTGLAIKRVPTQVAFLYERLTLQGSGQ